MQRRRNKKRIEKARHFYFKALNEQPNMLFERILWFDERKENPNFNWELNPQEYSSMNYMVWASTSYEKGRTIVISDAINSLISASEIIRRVGNYEGELRAELLELVQISEL